jgi:hypothetical protein
MTVKLELPPDVEAGLLAQAQMQGLTLEAYLVEHVLRGALEKPKSRREGRKSLAQLFAESPLKGLDLKFERNQDTGRPLSL